MILSTNSTIESLDQIILMRSSSHQSTVRKTHTTYAKRLASKTAFKLSIYQALIKCFPCPPLTQVFSIFFKDFLGEFFSADAISPLCFSASSTSSNCKQIW